MKPDIRIRRAYESPEGKGGARILVDRLWPRGLKKDEARIDAWLKDLAPSDALRKWFGHDPERWTEFKRRYAEELRSPEAKAALSELKAFAKRGPVTLLYAAKDEEHNNALALKAHLERSRS
jgi:uncharacterized protein YeaO (DUF488 family)